MGAGVERYASIAVEWAGDWLAERAGLSRRGVEKVWCYDADDD